MISSLTLPTVVLEAFRTLYGILMLLTLAQAAPQWRRFFVSEKWGGYAQSSLLVDVLQNPVASPLVGLIWAGCGVALVCGWHVVPAASLNLVLCAYFFIFMRWRGVLRGMGAPGYMTYWFGFALFLLESTRRYAPELQGLALLVLQVDFALIIFSAAFYKFRSGYPRGEGMDYGLVNPMWSYWPRFYRRLPSGHPLLCGLNQLAWASQLLSAVLMLIPATRFWGGLLTLATYALIVTQIRLGWLAEMMCAAALLFCVAGSPGAEFLGHWLKTAPTVTATPMPAVGRDLLKIFLWLHLLMLPLCQGGLFLNFYGRKRLPAPLQGALECYTNFFGIILWRVFSVDHLNFYVNIHRARLVAGSPQLLSQWQNPRCLRFWHVGEAIAVTSLFTTLKYYPSNDAIFQERLLRYARTFVCPASDELIFSYVSIHKADGRYRDRNICAYHVEPRAGMIRLETIDPSASPRTAHPNSPVHEAAKPGSYTAKPVRR